MKFWVDFIYFIIINVNKTEIQIRFQQQKF